MAAVLGWRSNKPSRMPNPASSLEMRSSSGEEEMEELSNTGLSKVLCTRRLPYFRNRLCVEVKTHTQDLVDFFTQSNSSDGESSLPNGLKVPDLTLDLAWMGCSTCTPELRVCSPGQPCRQDPKSSLRFPWIRIMPISLKSLIAGQCLSLSAMLVAPTVSAALLPFLGALAPYLGGVMGWASSRILDELLLGRYCLYLTTHVAGEVIAGTTLTQDSMCIDHLYTLHIPGIFGLVKARKVNNPESSLVCWPTAEAEALAAEGLLNSMEAMESDENEDEDDSLELPQIPHEALLRKDQVCREGANANVCVACTAVAQAVSWRMSELRTAVNEKGLSNSEDELGVVENKMLIHANTKEQCHGDADPKCLDDYSLCVLKPGQEEATACDATTVYHPEQEVPFCSFLCESTCGASMLAKAYCLVGEEHAGKTCRLERKAPEDFDHVRPSQFGGHWVHCDLGPQAKYTVQWQHRLLKIVEMRQVGNTTAVERAATGRQVMQLMAEPAPSAPEVTMLDAMLLRLAKLVGQETFQDASTSVCQEAACCDETTVRPLYVPKKG